jgi:antitoxin (DNA-binding transcriptional repressor) of toxin-antitoxin stability system
MVKDKARSRRTLAREARTITATEAAKNFGRLVNRVSEERVTYTVERGGRPVAQISPIDVPFSTIGDLKSWIHHHPMVDEEYLTAVEAAVARHNVPRVRRNRWER